MLKPKILFVFRRPVQLSRPYDYFYGYTVLKSFFTLLSNDVVYNHRFILVLQRLIDILISRLLPIGFSIIPSLFLIPTIRKVKLIFATTDSYGVPLALLKTVGLFSTPLVINTTGLYDGLARKKSQFTIRLCMWTLKSVDHFVCGQSFQECKKLSDLLSIPLVRFSFIPFGTDTVFFKPKQSDITGEILTIGADPYRDWPLFAQIAKMLPNERFRIVTFTNIVTISMPQNVHWEFNLSPIQLRERIWQAKAIFIPSTFNYHFAGQSTAMRSMSCAKPVIFTKTPGVDEYRFKHKKDCILVSPGNVSAVLEGLSYLNDSYKRKKLSESARQTIDRYYSMKNYSEGLKGIFYKVLKEN